MEEKPATWSSYLRSLIAAILLLLLAHCKRMALSLGRSEEGPLWRSNNMWKGEHVCELISCHFTADVYLSYSNRPHQGDSFKCRLKSTRTNKQSSLYTNTLNPFWQQRWRHRIMLCVSCMNARLSHFHCGQTQFSFVRLTVWDSLTCSGVSTGRGSMWCLFAITCFYLIEDAGNTGDRMWVIVHFQCVENWQGYVRTSLSAWQCLVSSQTCTIRSETTGALVWSARTNVNSKTSGH